MTMSPWQIYGVDRQHQALDSLNFAILLLHNAHKWRKKIMLQWIISYVVCACGITERDKSHALHSSGDRNRSMCIGAYSMSI